MNEIKILELFGGIGALTKAFKRLRIPYRVVDYVEIDKYAVKSYNAINGTNFEPKDICEWDKDIEVDLIMHGSPCQDFSLAGKQAGGDEGSGTRSSLMYETVRIVEKLKPKYVIWENVKNVLGKKHKHNFDRYITKMRMLGYWSYYQVLNAKDYGIPQNRERVFVVSIRDDVICYGCQLYNYQFPPKQELKLKLKDMLEEEVEEKYYLSNELTNTFAFRNESNNSNVAGDLIMDKWQECIKRIYDIDKYAPALSTMQGGHREPKILLKSKCKRLKTLVEKTEFEEGKVLNLDLYNQTTNEKISQCLTEPHHNSQRLFDGLRIRKLTPLECWRLMGFDDEDFEKAIKVNSNTQLYKQAGNSIVVNVLESILHNLFKENASLCEEVHKKAS